MLKSDRRRAERAPTLITVRYRLGRKVGSCTATDISETGIFLYLEPQPALGTELHLIFSLPDFKGLAPLKVVGKVARVVEKGEGPTTGVGIQFDAIYSESRGGIRLLVRSILDPDFELPREEPEPQQKKGARHEESKHFKLDLAALLQKGRETEKSKQSPRASRIPLKEDRHVTKQFEFGDIVKAAKKTSISTWSWIGFSIFMIFVLYIVITNVSQCIRIM